MSGGSPDTITQTNKSELPKEFQPLAAGLANYAGQVAQQPFYPGQQIAGISPEQEGGLQMATQRALYGSDVTRAAQNNAVQTLQGGYENPYIDAMVKRTQDDVMRRFGSQMAGNFGNTGVNQTIASQLADSGNAVRYQGYNDERGRQMQAMALAPNLVAGDYADAQALTGVGDFRRGYAQDILNLGKAEYNHPQQQLGILQNALASATGGTQTQTGDNPNQPNTAANAIAGGLLGYGAISGAGAAGMMGITNPWLGAALGAGAMVGLGGM
jgi:hypothetical protein